VASANWTSAAVGAGSSHSAAAKTLRLQREPTDALPFVVLMEEGVSF
jgi:hypothetical protein